MSRQSIRNEALFFLGTEYLRRDSNKARLRSSLERYPYTILLDTTLHPLQFRAELKIRW